MLLLCNYIRLWALLRMKQVSNAIDYYFLNVRENDMLQSMYKWKWQVLQLIIIAWWYLESHMKNTRVRFKGGSGGSDLYIINKCVNYDNGSLIWEKVDMFLTKWLYTSYVSLLNVFVAYTSKSDLLVLKLLIELVLLSTLIEMPAVTIYNVSCTSLQ